MIVKTLLAALVAGLIAGAFTTLAQSARVVPIILHAEEYEGKAPESLSGGEAPQQQHSLQEHSSQGSTLGDLVAVLSPVTPAYAHEGEHEEEGGIMLGLSRFSGSFLTNLVTSTGFSLLMTGVSLLIGYQVTLRNGVLWGACGWLTIHMLPAIGLPPELPGFPAADLHDRQIWWTAAVLLSGAGLYLLVLRTEIAAKIAGLGVIAAPHLYGAPQPIDISSTVPAVLGAEFAVAALATALASWIVLGLLLGYFNDRFLKPA